MSSIAAYTYDDHLSSIGHIEHMMLIVTELERCLASDRAGKIRHLDVAITRTK